MQPNVLKKA